MTVKEIFDLRKQGRIEEAYEAIRPMYRVHKGHYTSLCMYLCARDVFNIRLAEGRLDEASKIYQALQRLVPFIEDKDGKVSAFMQYASSRLAGLKKISDSAISYVPSVASEQSSSTAGPKEEKENICDICDICVTEKESFCVPPNLQRLLSILKEDMSVKEMMAALNFHSRDKFLKNYLSPALKAGLVEMTEPDSPKSPKQRYRRSKEGAGATIITT